MKFIFSFFLPKRFDQLAKYLIPWFWVGCIISFTYALIGGLFLAPVDYQQGDAFRIIYVHVPAAMMSLAVYVAMAVFSLIYLVWHIKLADLLGKASAPIGAIFTLIALLTGALWGKPMWGTVWIWDARLTSELILLFLYLGVITLRSSIPLSLRASSACSLLTLIGLVNIPIIHYSVYWWNTLHQKSTLLKLAKPEIDAAMLYPLLAAILAFILYYLAILLMKIRLEIYEL
jgi:heme exporter protein C